VEWRRRGRRRREKGRGSENVSGFFPLFPLHLCSQHFTKRITAVFVFCILFSHLDVLNERKKKALNDLESGGGSGEGARESERDQGRRG
jgi:hypothetical protein